MYLNKKETQDVINALTLVNNNQEATESFKTTCWNLRARLEKASKKPSKV